MKALTLHRPWPSLILAGLKHIENRRWQTRHRGWLLIHAGQKVNPDWWIDLWDRERDSGPGAPYVNPAQSKRALDFVRNHEHPTGVVGMVRVTGCPQDGHGIWYEPGAWGWELADPYSFSTPVPMPGKQRLWETGISAMMAFGLAGILCARCKAKGVVGRGPNIGECPACRGDGWIGRERAP